jgi:hypothetical protein
LFFYAAIKACKCFYHAEYVGLSGSYLPCFLSGFFLKKKVAKERTYISDLAALNRDLYYFQGRSCLWTWVSLLALMAALVGSLFNVFNKPIVAKHMTL